MADIMDDDDYEEKAVMFFGRDISKIPCFRNSFLYGLSSGLFTGLGCFMFTSRVHRSFQLGSVSYALVTFGYWMQCRYNYITNKIAIDTMQSELVRRVAIEGTALEEKFLADDDDDD